MNVPQAFACAPHSEFWSSQIGNFRLDTIFIYLTFLLLLSFIAIGLLMLFNKAFRNRKIVMYLLGLSSILLALSAVTFSVSDVDCS